MNFSSKPPTVRLLCAAFLGFVCACAPKVPEARWAELGLDLPERWASSQEAKAGVDHGWVARFHSPGLESAVDRAIAQQPDLKAAAARVRRAAAQAEIDRSAVRPKLDLNTDFTRQKQRFIGFPGVGGANIFDTVGVSLDLSWELDLWGAYRSGTEGLIALWQAEAESQKAAELSLAAQFCKAWFAAAEAQEQLRLAEQAVEFRRTTAKSLEERLESSLDQEGGTASQVFLARTDAATAAAEMEGWKQELDGARRQLELLSGDFAQGKIKVPTSLPKLPANPPAGLPSELLLRRPDIVAAERRFAARGRAIKQAKRAVYPSFNLTGSRGTIGTDLAEALDSTNGVWRLAGGLAQPILTGGRITGEIEARTADEEEALAQLQKSVLQGFYEVELALSIEKFLKRRIAALETAGDASDQAAEQANEEFSRGTANILVLLEAETRRLALRSQLIKLRRLRLDNRVNLHLALGGDFRVRNK